MWRQGLLEDRLLEVEAGVTGGQLAGGGGWWLLEWQGLLEDRLLEVEAGVAGGQVAGGRGRGYWRTACWRWRMVVELMYTGRVGERELKKKQNLHRWVRKNLGPWLPRV